MITAFYWVIKFIDFGNCIWQVGYFNIHSRFHSLSTMEWRLQISRFWRHWVVPQPSEKRFLLIANWRKKDNLNASYQSQYLPTSVKTSFVYQLLLYNIHILYNHFIIICNFSDSVMESKFSLWSRQLKMLASLLTSSLWQNSFSELQTFSVHNLQCWSQVRTSLVKNKFTS